MLQAAPARRSPGNNASPRWVIIGMLLLTAGAVAAAIGLLLQHAAATQADRYRSAAPAVITSTHHALLVGSIWMWSGTITTSAGVTILIIALQRQRR